MTPPELLTYCRARANLSQAFVAAALGVSQAAVQRWEAGTREPAWNDIEKYCRACGFSLEITAKKIT
jgi:transcriptional regulator with XRE-family HTH domain